MSERLTALPGNVAGALWVTVGAFAMSVQSAAIKHLGGEFTSMEIVFFRCLFGLALVVPMLVREGGPRFHLSRLPLHLWRSAAGLASMGCSFYAYTQLPLAEATALTFTMPLFLLVLGAVLLGERIGWRRTSAALVGFLGVLVMLRPGSQVLQGAALVALASAFFHAWVGILIKRLAAIESPGMIVLYFNLFGVAVFLLPALNGWVTPGPLGLMWMLVTALTGMVSQVAIIEACKVADISAVAPMDYSRVVFSTLLGLLFFAELPDAWSAVGAAVIIGSTLYITLREIRLARAARAQPPDNPDGMP